jgi:hypothetical protein
MAAARATNAPTNASMRFGRVPGSPARSRSEAARIAHMAMLSAETDIGHFLIWS